MVITEPDWQGFVDAARIGQKFCPWCKQSSTDWNRNSDDDRTENWYCTGCNHDWDVHLCIYEAAEVQWLVEGEHEDHHYAINLANMKVGEIRAWKVSPMQQKPCAALGARTGISQVKHGTQIVSMHGK